MESGFSFSLSPSTHIFLACSPSSISLCRIIIIPSASFFKNRNRTFFLFYFSYSFSLSLSVPPRFITRARTFTFFHLKRGRKKKRVVRCLGYNLVRSAETDRRFFFSKCVCDRCCTNCAALFSGQQRRKEKNKRAIERVSSRAAFGQSNVPAK